MQFILSILRKDKAIRSKVCYRLAELGGYFHLHNKNFALHKFFVPIGDNFGLHLIIMTSISIYLSFLGVLGSYRQSRFWPLPKGTSFSMPCIRYCTWTTLLLSLLLLCLDKGVTTGILFFLATLMAIFSTTIFFLASSRIFRLAFLLLVHLLCLSGFILSF